MGLGLFDGGVSVTGHLVDLGYDVLVTDLKDEAALAESVAAVRGPHVSFRLGEHVERDFVETDIVIVNPAVKPGNRFVAAASAASVRLDTEIGLFVRACRGRITGVTGSAGKSTTTALLHACLASEPGRRVHLGGNIGRSLLRALPEIGPDDDVVLELSSFQLHWLRHEGLRPGLAVLTNLTPNHLDWHGTMDAYRRDKAAIVPGAGGALVACADDAGARAIADEARCRVVWTSRSPEFAGVGVAGVGAGDAVFWREDTLVARMSGAERDVLRRADVRLLGAHALWNVASATAAALLLGVTDRAIVAAVREFTGLPHRLCALGTFAGVRCVDDSKSTTPDAAALALAAFDAPVRLLAGGYDKGLDPDPIVRAAATHATEVVCFGTTGEALAAALRRGAPGLDVVVAPGLVDAVRGALARSSPGDVLLLSPGHASWDQFENYEERGRVFADTVRAVHSAS